MFYNCEVCDFNLEREREVPVCLSMVVGRVQMKIALQRENMESVKIEYV